MTTKDIGDIGEKAAAQFLKKDGYRIVGRNKHFSHNEIDIIAEDGTFIVFVEVKARSVDPAYGSAYGPPSSAVTRAKQLRLIQAANAYLGQNRTNKQPRMDVVEVWLDKESSKTLKINHIRNAYGV